MVKSSPCLEELGFNSCDLSWGFLFCFYKLIQLDLEEYQADGLKAQPYLILEQTLRLLVGTGDAEV